MAVETKCQTPGAKFHTYIDENLVSVTVNLHRDLNLSTEEAELLEANLHNAVELVLAPFYVTDQWRRS